MREAYRQRSRNDLLDQFVSSGLPVSEFNQHHKLSKVRLKIWASKLGREAEYLEAVRLARRKVINDRKGNGKWNPVSDDIKVRAMEDFLRGRGTTQEIGNRYGFNKRRLRSWFKEERRLDEYEATIRNNIHQFSIRPPVARSLFKIPGAKNLAYKDGIKLEVKRGIIRGIKVLAPDHPDARRGYVYEHRLVMEKKLGRRLSPNECVHHIDLDPTNNHEDNLLLLSSNQHGMLHVALQYALVELLTTKDLQVLTRDLFEQIEKGGLCR